MRDAQRILYLLIHYREGSLSLEERKELDHWINQSAKNKTLFYELLDQAHEEMAVAQLLSTDTETSLKNLKLRIAHSKKPARKHQMRENNLVRKRNRTAIVAAMLLFLSGVSLLHFQNRKESNTELNQPLSSLEIFPGGNKATLTLADGSIINLDDASPGKLRNYQGVEISKTTIGQLIYKTDLSSTSSSEINTITTPRGGQYQVILPDGTKVWLNASSSLSYPVTFDNKERKVKLSGEAYFEVTKTLNRSDDKVPFIIELNNQQHVEVLGTKLNIQAYQEEKRSKTTLVEGRVNVHAQNLSVSLKPGQQAQITKGENEIAISAVQSAEHIAWKNGYFNFDNEPIQDIMAKIARWYDVDIQYQGKIPDDGFSGIVSRFDNVSELLNLLELTEKINFKVEGRRITVMP